jgi:hypothetical protein
MQKLGRRLRQENHKLQISIGYIVRKNMSQKKCSANPDTDWE